MKKGGYAIFDFSGISFSVDKAVKIPGIYEKIKGATKPILISGLVFDDNEYCDRFVSPENVGLEYVIPISDVRYMGGASLETQMHMALWLEITAQDNVTARYYEG